MIDFVFGVFMIGMMLLYLVVWFGKVEVIWFFLEVGVNVNVSLDNGDIFFILVC